MDEATELQTHDETADLAGDLEDPSFGNPNEADRISGADILAELPGTVSITPEDRPILESFAEYMRPHGLTTEMLAAAINWLEIATTEDARNDYEILAAVDDEIAEIEEIMRTDSKRYYRDEGLQARYRRLLQLKEDD